MLTTALRSLNLAAAACAALAAGVILWLTMQGEAVTVLGWSNGLAAPTVQAVVTTQAQPVAPRTDMERFAVDLAAALGNAQPSPALVAFLVAWHQAEGGSAAFNPFNTTQDWSGATIYNSVGVKNYASYQDGLAATVTTLGYGYNGYQDIREGIRTNDPARSLRGLYASPWGTSAALVEQVYKEQLSNLRQNVAISLPDSTTLNCPLARCVITGYTFNAATHPGVDYGAALNDPVHATIAGRAKVTPNSWPGGNCVEVFGADGLSVLTCHLNGFAVADGATVTAGDVIGYAGATGLAYGVHTHFEIRRNGVSSDPEGMK